MVRSGLDAARRRVRRNRIGFVVVVVLVVAVLGGTLGLTSAARPGERFEPSGAVEAVGTTLLVLGLVVTVVAGVRARRHGALRLAWNSPTVGLDRANRKRLLRQIRADAGVPPADQDPATTLAEALERQRFLLPAYGGFVVGMVGESLLTSLPLSRWLFASAVVAFAVALPLIARDSRRARTWLAHHGATV